MAQELEATVTNAVTHCPTCREIFAAGLRFCPKDGGQLVNGYPPGAGRDAGGVAGPGREKDAKATSPLVGTVLAERYRIVRKIGEGGMGEVFEAQHVYIDKRFAIKTLRPEITTNPDAVARFHQEARSASTIGHENIVEIDDFGRLPDGGVYLAMEFLDGISLGDRMKQKPPLPLGEALDYMMQVAQGLAAAHEKGIVHRDMKPENIFLTNKTGRTGRVVAKILDFGIAKVLSDGGQKSLTQTGAVFGTPYYMSPEQALGKSVDSRADVYSFGVILYEVFTGRVPFEGESFMGILSQHITAPPQTPSLAAPDRTIPLALERVILRAMAKDPERRYPSMIALGEDLEKVRNGSASVTQHAQLVNHARKAESVVMPTAESIHASAPLELDRPGLHGSSIGAAQNGLNDSNQTRRGRGKAMVAAATAVLLAVGIAGLVMRRTPPSPTRKGSDPGGATLQATLGNLTPPPSTRLMPADPAEGEVLLDTNPPGAVVYANGQRISETPGLIKVPGGKLLEVLLRKDGFAPKQVRLDGTDKRLIVPLERVHHAGSHLAPAPQPLPPSPTIDEDRSAPQNGARVKKPAPRPFNGIDPGYEALPPPSKKTPRNAPPPNAPLDPY